MPAFFLASAVAVLILPLLFGFVLKKMSISNTMKIWIFTFLSAFMSFIVLIPVPTIFIVPMPNAIALMAIMFSDPSPSSPTFANIYIDLWSFNAPSFMATFLLFRVIAAFVFPLPKAPEKPI